MPQYDTVTAVDLNIIELRDVKLCRQALHAAGSSKNVSAYLSNITSHPRKTTILML
jgi:hypothetical protein